MYDLSINIFKIYFLSKIFPITFIMIEFIIYRLVYINSWDEQSIYLIFISIFLPFYTSIRESNTYRGNYWLIMTEVIYDDLWT